MSTFLFKNKNKTSSLRYNECHVLFIIWIDDVNYDYIWPARVICNFYFCILNDIPGCFFICAFLLKSSNSLEPTHNTVNNKWFELVIIIIISGTHTFIIWEALTANMKLKKNESKTILYTLVLTIYRAFFMTSIKYDFGVKDKVLDSGDRGFEPKSTNFMLIWFYLLMMDGFF